MQLRPPNVTSTTLMPKKFEEAKMSFSRRFFKVGANIYFKTLPYSTPLASLMLLPVENLNGAGNLIKIIKKAQKENHPLFEVLKRLAAEINPRCREMFVRHHVSLLFNQRKNKNFFPKVLIVSVTSKCNFACADCFNNAFSEKKELGREVLDRILSEAEEKGTEIVALSGGEPLIRRDIFDIIERHPGVYFQIFTNGSLISEKIVQRIAELGNVMPFISLEGDEEMTDKRRGKGSYKKVFDVMKLLKKHGIIFGSNVMVTPENFNSTTSAEFVNKLIEAGAMMIWYITYRPIGEKPDFNLVLSESQHIKLYRAVQRVRNTFPIVALENLHDVAYFGGCPAKLGVAIHIDSLGNVTPCPPIHFANQSITNQGLENALNNSPLVERIMKREGRGCIILEEPQELIGIVERTGANETDSGKDIEALKKYMAFKIAKSEVQSESSESVDDIYAELKEALTHGRKN